MQQLKMPEELKKGDKVVALLAAIRTAAIVSGAVSGAMAGWLARHNITTASIAFFGGALMGWLIGTIFGKILFPAEKGNIWVVKCGFRAFVLTLRGNLIASAVTSIIVCGLMAIFTEVQFITIAIPCVGITVVLGSIGAFISST